MPSNSSRPSPDRRAQKRFSGGGFPLLAPPDAKIIDCGPRGVGIETKTHLPVGGLTTVNVFRPGGELALLGRVCWARLVENRPIGERETEPVFRAGVCFVEGQSFDAWDRLLSGLLTPNSERRKTRNVRRRVVRWRSSS